VHESNQESGGLFEVGCGWVSKLRRQQSQGIGFDTKSSITPEMIRDKFSQIVDFSSNSYFPTTPNDSIGRFTENAFTKGEDSGNQNSTSGNQNFTSGKLLSVEDAKKKLIFLHFLLFILKKI